MSHDGACLEYRFPFFTTNIDEAGFAAMAKGCPPNDGIVVYGAGRHGKQICEFLERNGHPVACFCDANADRQKQTYCGKRIISPDALCGEYGNHVVFISAYMPLLGIKSDLAARGFPPGRILIPPFLIHSHCLGVPEALTPPECAENAELAERRFPGKRGNRLREKPSITVKTHVYNVHEGYLRRAIESVLNQSLPHFKYVVFDNGSTDGSAEIIDRYAAIDPRISVVRSKVNLASLTPGEPAYAKVLELVCGELDTPYVCNLDSDDQYEPDFLETTYRLAVEHDADMVAGQTILYFERDPGAVRKPDALWISSAPIGVGVFRGRRGIADMMCDFNYIWRSAWGKLEKAEKYKERFLAPVPEKIGSLSDTYNMIRALERCDTVVMTDEVLHKYTIREQSVARIIDERSHFLVRSFTLYDAWMRYLRDSDALTDKNVSVVRNEMADTLRYELGVFRSCMAGAPAGRAESILKAAVATDEFARLLEVPEFAEVLADLEFAGSAEKRR